MLQNPAADKKILITGGTSGLGLELVRLFLEEGYNVVATGRQSIDLPKYGERFKLYTVDFADLDQVACQTRIICSNHSFSFIINNAGVLSPPSYSETSDGFEYSFQVNFLSHLLIDEIILSSFNYGADIGIVSITSPLYRFASLKADIITGLSDYNPIQAYSSSKLYLALMCEILGKKHDRTKSHSFSYDPGTFSSGIYRMQSKWFWQIYRIAAPFMRSPYRVAKILKDLIMDENTGGCRIYDIRKRGRSFPDADKQVKEAFIDYCYKLIDPFLHEYDKEKI